MADKTEGKDEGFFAKVKDALEAPVTKVVGYFEREDHRPDPFFQRGQVDTTDTSGVVPDVREVSHVFDEARAKNMQVAARALDPNDPSVPAELVTLPEGAVSVVGTTKTADEGRDDVLRAVQQVAEHPVEIGGLTPAQQAAAEDTSAKDETAAGREDSSDTPASGPSAVDKQESK